MKKALVTGGAGFIGSNLVDLLLEKNYEVMVVDNQSANSHDEYYWNNKSKNYEFDVSENQTTLTEMCRGCDYIFHLASDVSIPYCIENPSKAYLNNVSSLCSVLEAARHAQVDKVVFSYTAAIYGLTNKVCLETDIPDPLNPYSVSKLSGEHLMKMYYDLYGIKTISLRYFNVYGPRQPKTGQYAPVMGIFLEQKNRGESLTIVGDGMQTRDFIHVSDIASANLTVAEKDVDEYGQIYNVGTGKATSVKKIARMISDDTEHLPPRPAEARHSLANVSKMKRVYGWEYNVKLEDWISEQ
jgi:UDP-glucose 4-epimerase